MSARARHEARILAVQFLFQRDFNRDEFAPARERFWEGRKSGPDTRRFADELIDGVEDQRTGLDEKLAALAEHWDLRRMGAVDRAILRMGLFELLHRPDIPPVVTINEGVELAKEFSGAESGRFINGILDRAARGLDRPARCAAVETRFTRSTRPARKGS
ncbi:MAG: transcription antitermination factor NusB [Kiritimatiellia bacterium]|nr:transcription antitermination factor NusB [Kiritimatiellia bacterium]